jgi:hypothetical protein
VSGRPFPFSIQAMISSASVIMASSFLTVDGTDDEAPPEPGDRD